MPTQPASISERILRPGILFTVITLFILGVVIAAITLPLRERLHTQILNRDASVLHSVAQMLIAKDEQAWLFYETLGDTADLRTVLFETSELRGVIGLRMYDASGSYLEAVPQEMRVKNLDTLPESPTGNFLPEPNLSDYFIDASPDAESSYALQVIIMPMMNPKDEKVFGYAEYIIDGQAVQAELASIDSNLKTQAGLAWITGSAIAAAIIFFALWKLAAAQIVVEERSRKLVEANAELTLAAKTNAIGAVTAHLLHGLKNPLSGISHYIDSAADDSPEDDEDVRKLAADSARRMQRMIQEIVEVVQQEETQEAYSLTLSEMMQLIESKATAITQERGIKLSTESAPNGEIDSRRCNLLLLVTSNLINNAAEAMGTKQGEIYISIAGNAGDYTLRICDNGPGLPEAVRKHLFKPVQSSKSGGSGIGLAISRELAKSIDASLILESTSSAGTTFAIEFNSSTSAIKAMQLEKLA